MRDLKLLIKNGVHWGHQTRFWNPAMKRFIWGSKDGVHLIDISKTATAIEKASAFLEEVAAQGKQILWVGTKTSAQESIKNAAKKTNSPSVCHRWIGGTLTNFSQVKKSVTKLLHYEDILDKIDKYSYTKKECGVFQKIVERLEKNVGGLRDFVWPVGAVVVVDVKREAVTIKEAKAKGIPVVALVDTNCDPSGIDYVIPGNDDVARAIAIVIDDLADAAARGTARVEKKQQKKVAEKVAAEETALALKKLEEDEAKKAAAATSKKAKKDAIKEDVVVEAVVAVEAAPEAKKSPAKKTAKKDA